jgi:lipopolysaccharide/colanic/teichoic acid biosynthesis glycosyltransferase
MCPANEVKLIMKNEMVDVSEELVPPTAGFGPTPVWKRVLDVGCVLLALPVLLPVTVALAVLIKCVSPGPILFLQERVGYRGRRFICFKFRTMKMNADTGVHRRHLADLVQSNAPMVKMDSKGDPRLIPFGAFLRATGLDELPQLLNVLEGQMSLVGPRPCVVYEYEHYLPSQKRRFETLPGLTGLWQVSGKNKTTFSEMIALDVHYAENKSPWLDLKIMFKTLPALVSQVREARAMRNNIAIDRMGPSPVLIPRNTPTAYRAECNLLSQR